MKKKLLSLLIAAVMIVTAQGAPFSVQAAETAGGGGGNASVKPGP